MRSFGNLLVGDTVAEAKSATPIVDSMAMKIADSPRPNDGAIIFLTQYMPCPCEARPGWPYLRFMRNGQFLAVLEEITDWPANSRILAVAGANLRLAENGSNTYLSPENWKPGIVTQAGWRRLNLSMHAEWLVYQHCDWGTVEIWNYPEAQRLHRFHLAADITQAEFRPDGVQLACLLGRDVPGIWCWAGKWGVRKIGDERRVFSFLTYSGDSRFLAAAGEDRRIYLWNAETLETAAVSPPQQAIAGLSVNEEGTLIATGAAEEVRIWESGGGLLRSLPVGKPVWRTFFSPKGDMLVVVHDNGVEIWDARAGLRLGSFDFPVEHAYFQVAFRSDGTAAAWGNSSRGCAGPLTNPLLGFFSRKAGGLLTSIGEAPTAAGWAFQGTTA